MTTDRNQSAHAHIIFSQRKQMNIQIRQVRWPEGSRIVGALAVALALCTAAQAHDYRAGDVRIGHPYATPNVPSSTSGAAYIATLENTGPEPDRLLRLSSPVAGRVEMHNMNIDTEGVMRMRMVDSIAVMPSSPIKMRPGQGFHFMLTELKQALKEGDTFPMTMEFERGGKVEVKVVVQVPKVRAPEHAAHQH
jgi:copper(I)-binding protein